MKSLLLNYLFYDKINKHTIYVLEHIHELYYRPNFILVIVCKN